jgi:cell division protein ZapA
VAQVNLTVNGRQYSVGCNDGEEDHVNYLAEYVDTRMKDLIRSVGQVGEARLLLMTALLVADDLASASDDAEELRASIRQLEGDGEKAGQVAHLAAPRIADAARRLEAVAARLRAADDLERR